MFRSLLTAAAVITFASLPTQALELVNQDGTELSQLCIEAATTGSLTKSAFRGLVCNGVPVKQFTQQYAADTTRDIIEVSAFVNTDKSVETRLCIAAATSNEAYSQTKNRLFGTEIVRNISCNGQSLASFAKQYNAEFNG